MMMSMPGDDRASFAHALTSLALAVEGDDLCSPIVSAAAVTGGAISTLGPPLGSQTVGATDKTATRIAEIQIDLGEGPAWQALRSRRPVLDATARQGSDGWPGARDALASMNIGGLFAFPLFVGDLDVGSVDLYTAEPHQLSQADVDDVTVLAGIVSRLLLRNALNDVDNVDEGISAGPYSRREVHQATGMVAAQLRVSVDDALLVIRGRAFSEGRPVSQVAAEVVARRLTFAP